MNDKEQRIAEVKTKYVAFKGVMGDLLKKKLELFAQIRKMKAAKQDNTSQNNQKNT